jgi:hypothetical protein
MNITVRLTEDEKTDLTAKAKDTLGQDATLSDYVRTRLFENDQAAAIREANRQIVLAIQEGCAPLPGIEAKITSLAAHAEDQGQPPSERLLRDAVKDIQTATTKLCAALDAVLPR